MKKIHSLNRAILPIALSLSTAAASAFSALAAGGDSGCSGCLKNASGLFSKGDNAGAAKVLTEWQSKCPDNLQLLLMLNTVLMRTKDGKAQALGVADQACKLAPNNMLPHFQKAMTLMTMQQDAAAAKEFQAVVDIDPTSYEAWSALGDLLGAQGDAAGAKAASEKAMALSPSAKAAQIAAITSKNRAGNISAVKLEIDKAGQGSAETLLTVGAEAFKLGYFGQAERLLMQASSKYPQATPVRDLLPLAVIFAKITVRNPQYGSFSKKEKGSSSVGLTFHEGVYDLYQGHDNEAIEKFGDAFSRDKNLTVARLFTAQTYLTKGDYKAAIGEAKETANLASGLKPACQAIELTARLRDGEDTGSAIAALKNAINGDMARSDAFNQAFAEAALGELAIKEKDLGSAKTHFEKARDYWPSFVPAACGLGQVALVEGNNDAAIAQLDKTLTTAPGDGRALSLKALALVSSGKMEEAQKILEELGTGERSLPAQMHIDLAVAMKKSGHEKEAAAQYRKAMEAGATGALMQQAKDGLKDADR